ncbi:hypothetical protein AB4Z25_25235 [Rhizobium sp. RAF36]|uniref:hypothetical protein n=1 Tax=Rhizobium sp. RAF36 TaxID=3233055 RepID=UPI003F9B201E
MLAAGARIQVRANFHDGSDFNAAVAKWNVDRMISHPKSMAKQNVAGITSVAGALR